MKVQLSTNEIAFPRVFGRVIRTPIHAQTYRNLAYLVSMFPLGICYFTLITVAIFTGVLLIIVGIGIPIILVLFVLVVELAGLERRLVRSLLDVDISVPSAETDGSLWTRTRRLVTALRTWKAVAYLLSEFLYGSFVFGILASGGATAVSFLLAPLYYTEAPVTAYGPIPTSEFTLDVLFGWDSLLVGLTTTFQLGSWRIETLLGAVLVSAVGVVLLWVSLVVSNAAAGLWRRYARRMLTTPRYWTTPDW